MTCTVKVAAVYARVSTEDQAEKGYSLESQIEECLKRAEELGFERRNVTVITDDVSGAVADRPGLNRLREWCGRPDRPEAVIVYDPDRLARKLALQLMLTDEWLRRGISLEFVNFEWNNTPEGRMFYQLRGMFAEFEREKIRERTIRGRMAKLKSTGKLSGDPRLFGYRFDTERDVLVVDPETAAVVQRIFRLAAGGCSGEEIARRLAKEGVPAPRGSRWHGSTVTRMLHNRSYLGEYKAYKTDYHQGYKRIRPESEQFAIPIEPLVSPELFEDAQRTLLRTRTRTGRPSKRGYLLGGLARCSCGRSMVAGSASSASGYAYYVCSSKLKTSYPAGETAEAPRCDNGYWNTSATDEAVWRELVRLLTLCRQEWAYCLGRGRMNVDDTEIRRARNRLAEAETKLGRLAELYLSGGIRRELYDEKRLKLEQEADRWRELLVAQELMKQTADAAVPHPWHESDRETEGRLSALPLSERKQIASLLLEEAQLLQDRTVRLKLRLSLPVNPCDSQSHGGL